MWGQIYCDMEANGAWGDRSNIQYSIPNKPDCLLVQTTQDYILRVGGTVEAKQCLDNFFYEAGFPFKP